MCLCSVDRITRQISFSDVKIYLSLMLKNPDDGFVVTRSLASARFSAVYALLKLIV